MDVSSRGRVHREGALWSSSRLASLKSSLILPFASIPLQQFAAHTHVFPYSSSPKKDPEAGADSFGVETRGQVMLLPWTKFDEVVKGMEGFLGGME